MVNKVVLIGNLGKDPEIRHLENGTSVGKFSVATNESYKDKNSGEWKTQTEWHDVVVWRGLAERAERDLKKGKLVYVEGKLTHRKWQDKDGNDRYTTEVVANTFRLLEKRENTGGGFSNNMPGVENAPVENKESTAASTTVANNKPADAGDDDLPF